MAIIYTGLAAYDEPDMFNEPYPALSSVFRKRLKKRRHYEAAVLSDGDWEHELSSDGKPKWYALRF